MDLLDIRQVSEKLNVSLYTVRKEIDRKRLAIIRVGRRVMISPADLEEYIRRRRVPARYEQLGKN